MPGHSQYDSVEKQALTYFRVIWFPTPSFNTQQLSDPGKVAQRPSIIIYEVVKIKIPKGGW